MQRGAKPRGQGLLIVALSAVVAGLLLIGAGLLTMNSFECRPGQAGSLSIDAGGAVKSNCQHVANSPATARSASRRGATSATTGSTSAAAGT